MSLTASRIYLAVGAVVVGGYFLLTGAAQDIVYTLVGASAVGALLLGVRYHRPDRPLPWYIVACGLLMFVVGDAIWAYHENVLDIESPFPSTADIFYLAGYPLLAIGLVLATRFRAPDRSRAPLIDVALITVGGGLLLWIFLINPYVEDSALSLFERLVSLSYPLGDLLLVAVTARLIFLPGIRLPAHYLIVLSLVLLLISDIFYSQLLLLDAYESGNPIDAGWLFSYLLFGVAALHPSMRVLSGPATEDQMKLTLGRWFMLAAALSAAPAALALQLVVQGSVDIPVIVGGWVVLILLVMARMATILRSRERVVSRERLLRNASAALVAAPDRERIYAGTLEAILPFIDEAPGTRVSIWSGSAEKDVCVGAAGHRASEIEGRETRIREFPDRVRTPLLEGRAVDLRPGESTEFREAFGFSTKEGGIFMVPLFVEGRFEGRIVVASDSDLPGDIKYALETLSTQVALALERTEAWNSQKFAFRAFSAYVPSESLRG